MVKMRNSVSCSDICIVLITALGFAIGTTYSLESTTDGTGPVFIIEPPSKVDVSSRSATIILNCLVHGDPEPTVTWHLQSGKQIESNSRVFGGLFAKVLRNNSLELKFTASREDIVKFDASQSSVCYCKASNRHGSIVSPPVRINTVTDSQLYTTRVYADYVMTGNTATFTCHLPSYISDYVRVTAWIRDDHIRIERGLQRPADEKYIIDEDGKLYILDVENVDAGSVYKCETKHKLSGKTEITSDEAAGTLYVTSLSSSIPPAIAHTKQEVSVKKGEKLFIPCVAVGHPTPIYSWCFRHIGSESCEPIKASNRTSIVGSLIITSAIKGDNGVYVCKAENDMGQDQAVTRITVFTLISVFIHPQVQVADIGKSALIQCIASGGPIKVVKWFKDGQMISEKVPGPKESTFVFNISKTSKTSQGMYQCFVENDWDVKQASGQLVLSAVPPEFVDVFRRQVKQRGDHIELSCSATGDPLPSITWSFNGSPITTEGRRTIKTSTFNGIVLSSLGVENIATTDGGLYNCIAANNIGEEYHNDRLDVHGPPVVLPIANVTSISGRNAILDCYYRGYPIKSINWFKESKLLTSNERIVIHDNSSLEIKSVDRSEDQGQYKCQVIGKNGFTSSANGMLKIIEKPVLAKLLSSQILETGRRLHLVCTLQAGDPPVQFTWLFNDEKPSHKLDIIEADSVFSSSINVVEINDKHSGNYTCRAENRAGTDAQTMSVFVKSPPRWITKPVSQEVFISQFIILPCSGKGYPTPKAHWIIRRGDNKTDVEDFSNKQIHDNGSLVINALQREDLEYVYICSISNGIKPGLVSEINLSLKKNDIIFDKNFQNNIQVQVGNTAILGCQAGGLGPFSVHWINGSEEISRSTKRINYQKKEMPGQVTSSLEIKEVRPSDTGIYTCKVSSKDVTNKTSIFLNVMGSSERIVGNILSNEPKSVNVYSTSETDGKNQTQKVDGIYKLFSGVTLLYIIPTTTAAVVLLIILVIVCVLLCGQRRKSNKMASTGESKQDSTLMRKTDDNYIYDENMSTMPRTNARYSDLKSNGRRSLDGNIYDPMSTYPRTSSQIQPYATFTSDTKSLKNPEALGNSSTVELKLFE